MNWSDFTDADYDFFQVEFNFDREAVNSMNEDARWDLYDWLCDIEIDETCKHLHEDLSERGETAVRLVNLIYNPGVNDPVIKAEFEAAMREEQ